MQAWLNEQFPEIEKRAKAEGREIHWGDETALVNTDGRGRVYAPAGKTPVTYAVGGTRQKLSSDSVSSRTKFKTNWQAPISPKPVGKSCILRKRNVPWLCWRSRQYDR